MTTKKSAPCYPDSPLVDHGTIYPLTKRELFAALIMAGAITTSRTSAEAAVISTAAAGSLIDVLNMSREELAEAATDLGIVTRKPNA